MSVFDAAAQSDFTKHPISLPWSACSLVLTLTTHACCTGCPTYCSSSLGGLAPFRYMHCNGRCGGRSSSIDKPASLLQRQRPFECPEHLRQPLVCWAFGRGRQLGEFGVVRLGRTHGGGSFWYRGSVLTRTNTRNRFRASPTRRSLKRHQRGRPAPANHISDMRTRHGGGAQGRHLLAAELVHGGKCRQREGLRLRAGSVHEDREKERLEVGPLLVGLVA